MFKDLILVHLTLRCCQWNQRYFRESGNSKYLTSESWVSGGGTALIYVESWYQLTEAMVWVVVFRFLYGRHLLSKAILSHLHRSVTCLQRI